MTTRSHITKQAGQAKTLAGAWRVWSGSSLSEYSAIGATRRCSDKKCNVLHLDRGTEPLAGFASAPQENSIAGP